MKKSGIILFSFISLYINAQSSFARGYKAGWKEGYCYESTISCIPPVPPIPPIPRVGESSDSYKDGYNRGLIDGMNENKSSSQNNGRIRERTFRTASPNFKNDYLYTPPWEMMKMVAEIEEKKIENIIQKHRAFRQALSEIPDLDEHFYKYYKDRADDIIVAMRKKSDASLFVNAFDELWVEMQDNLRKLQDNLRERKRRENSTQQAEKFDHVSKQKDKDKEDIVFKKVYIGEVKVYSYTPMYDIPNMIEGETIDIIPPDKKVTIMSREKEGKYYKVSLNGKVGYIFTGFIAE